MNAQQITAELETAIAKEVAKKQPQNGRARRFWMEFYRWKLSEGIINSQLNRRKPHESLTTEEASTERDRGHSRSAHPN
jgi:hypothetical protein